MSKPAPEPKEKVEPRKKCFIIGPIGSAGTETRRNADFLLQGIIEEALKDMPYDIIRADQESSVGSITTDVVNRILESDLIIADLSEHNPNAFYELGIAHANRKAVIHVCRKGFSIPFDTSHERTVFFDLTDWQEIVSARGALSRMVEHVSSPDFKVSNPYTVATDLKKWRAGDDKDKKIAELSKENERLTLAKENVEKGQDSGRIATANARREVRDFNVGGSLNSNSLFSPLKVPDSIEAMIDSQKKFEESGMGQALKQILNNR
ncbi:hypothetical protein QMA67_09440 [Gluconobacter japonicus]|uniref:hypothetical protein n=1 Tax=Gluconobacter japonicus TaxID=376620 RepID=UPI0024AD947D|nr:hypothetical protein [Gluconobacter japonicus]MDI6653161.1 hypothetical protein [Gluconobacter japonicus]